MNNTASRIIRSEEITIDMRICTILAGGKKPGEVYFAAIAPDMELTVITLDEVPDILPCFDESDVSINLPDTSLLLTYNPAQVLKLAGKRNNTQSEHLLKAKLCKDVSEENSDNGRHNIAHGLAPHFTIAAFQSFQTFTLFFLFLDHAFHAQGQFFNRCGQRSRFAYVIFQQGNSPVLAGVFFFETPPELFMLGSRNWLVHLSLLSSVQQKMRDILKKEGLR